MAYVDHILIWQEQKSDPNGVPIIESTIEHEMTCEDDVPLPNRIWMVLGCYGIQDQPCDVIQDTQSHLILRLRDRPVTIVVLRKDLVDDRVIRRFLRAENFG